MDKKTLELLGPPPFRSEYGTVLNADGRITCIGFLSWLHMRLHGISERQKYAIDAEFCELLADALNRKAGVE